MNVSKAHNFNKGLDQDTAKETIGSDKITNANDIDFMTLEENQLTWAYPFKSTKLATLVPDAAATRQIDRLEFFGAGTYTIQIYDTDGNPLFGFPIGGTFTNFSGFSSSINFFAQANGYSTIISPLQGQFFTISFQKNPGPVSLKYKIVYTYANVKQVTYTVQDAILVNTQLKPIAGWNIQNIAVIFSCGVSAPCDEIGVLELINGTYRYTRIIRSTSLGFNDSNAFTIRIENQANDFYGIYWTDTAHKDKVLYFPKNYSTDCALKWTFAFYNTANPDGYYTLGSLDSATNLQLINNIGRCEYINQIQGGGNVASGGWRYSVRFGVSGTDNTTEWSYLSQLIPVFKTSTDSPSGYPKIQGDPAGELTNKINVLLVQGAMPETFDFCQLAAVHYAGETTSAIIVSKFYFTTSEFQIQHTGFESDSEDLDVNTLINVNEIILTSETLEIKKNRLNLANNSVAITDGAFVPIIANIIQDYGKKELQSVGAIRSTGSSTQVVANFLNPITNGGPNITQTIVFPNVVTDRHNEYNPSTGVFTLGTSGVLTVQIDYSVIVSITTLPPAGVVGTVTFNIFKNGVSLAQSPAFNLTSGAAASTFTSFDMFGTDLFSAVPGDFFSLQITYGGSVLSGTIYSDTQMRVSYADSSATLLDFGNTRVAEYQQPENVAKFTGYMVNERYVFYVRLHLNNGFITDPLLIPDVQRFQDNAQGLFTDNNNANDIKVYAYHLILNNIDVATLKSMGVIGMSIWRAVCNPTITTGVVLLADAIVQGTNYVSGYDAAMPYGTNGRYGLQIPLNLDIRKNGVFISPDSRVNIPNYSSGDVFLIQGLPMIENNFDSSDFVINNEQNQPILCRGGFASYKGFRATTGFTTYSITDNQYVQFNALGGRYFNNTGLRPSNVFNANTIGGNSSESLAFEVLNRIVPPAGSVPENGVYLAQYKKNIAQQYDLDNVKIIPTGTFIEFDETTPDILNGVEVFGGDTYTQKTTVKLLYGVKDPILQPPLHVRYSFIQYYSQNRVNTQLFYTDLTQPEDTWNLGASGSVNAYLFPAIVSNSNPQEQFNYDKGYIAPNVTNQVTPFLINKVQNSRFVTRIWYSEQKPTGSVLDLYRNIKPLSFKDLDAKDGKITELYDVNDVMICIQPNAVSVLPYQSDIAISATNSDGSVNQAVYLGNGGVYAQRESIVSRFGTNIKTAVCLGTNQNGNNTLYWLSEQFKKLMKYNTSNGAFSISDLNFMRSWFQNNTLLLKENFDVVMGYDTRRESLLITTRGYDRAIPNWDVNIEYGTGDLVNYENPAESNTFENLPNIYRSLIDENIGFNPFNTLAWQFIQPPNNQYYNIWTLLYNERMNAFSTFATFIPSRYFKYEDILICPNPRASYGRLYELFGGDDYLKYFQENDSFKPGQYMLEVSTNMLNRGISFPMRQISVAMQVGDEHVNNPTLESYNDFQDAITTAVDMELRRADLCCAVRNDNQGRPLISQWASYKITNTQFMKLKQLVINFYTKMRNP